MLITPAYAQSPFGGSTDMLTSLLPFVLIFVIMYFLILRPQQKRVKQHAEMVKNVRKGDTVITSGGLVGRVTKVIDDDQIEVEVADGVRVRQMKASAAPRPGAAGTRGLSRSSASAIRRSVSVRSSAAGVLASINRVPDQWREP